MHCYHLCHKEAVHFLKFVYVFFFQAEDGIRDVAVTGVQTCALPIYLPAWRTDPADDAGFSPAALLPLCLCRKSVSGEPGIRGALRKLPEGDYVRAGLP